MRSLKVTILICVRTRTRHIKYGCTTDTHKSQIMSDFFGCGRSKSRSKSKTRRKSFANFVEKLEEKMDPEPVLEIRFSAAWRPSSS